MTTTAAPGATPVIPPSERPITTVGPLGWLRKNLFRTPLDTALTLLVVYIVVALGVSAFNWVVNDAQWMVITTNFRVLLQGQYPGEHGWRIGLSVILATALAGLSWGIWGRIFRSTAVAFVFGVVLFVLLPLAQEITFAQGNLGDYLGGEVLPLLLLLRDPVLLLMFTLALGYFAGRGFRALNRKFAARVALFLWFLGIPVVFFLVRGLSFVPSLDIVPTSSWGGLLLTFMLAAVAIVACFPLGILLALGRVSGGSRGKAELPPQWWLNPMNWLRALGAWWRSLGNYPVIKLLCIVYIEFFRGVPLVTVFFTGSLVVPLALGDASIDGVVRAMVALTLFEAAYIAEIVRGGLQALPPGQFEAAKALNLHPVFTTLFITLPQALRIVIPALVGQFITMFKDTSLVAIIGLTELLGISRAVLSQTEFIGRHREMYVFAAIVYFVFSFGMSYAARQLERSRSGRAVR